MPIRKWGAETLANSATLGTQQFPDVLGMTNGDFAIAFDSELGIRLRLFDANGNPVAVVEKRREFLAALAAWQQCFGAPDARVAAKARRVRRCPIRRVG